MSRPNPRRIPLAPRVECRITLLVLGVILAGRAHAQGAPADTSRAIRQPPAAPAGLARERGWMPLATTGVPAFLSAHPTWDGRGVLIAILDTGIDPAAPGLGTTADGQAKVLDLRDFSGEGRIALQPAAVTGDSIRLAGQVLGGASRLRGLGALPWFAGVVRERRLGQAPAADLNDNGQDGDSLLVVVGRTAEGWVLLADTDGDGSLAQERPVRDFLHARETFGWHRPGEPSPLTIAVNFSEQPAEPPSRRAAGPPELHLVFDTEAHGTHVAGIAAGHDIGGAAGFHGVAPGGQLVGLKISRNDLGGVTTSGSVRAAMDYAIRFAAERRLPLVINLSFGVGNEREGAARLDQVLDSILMAHPEVVFVTSVGNDGPGLSTVGFPGSARRAITAGASQPSAFLPPRSQVSDPVIYFSSRGGELAKPDLVVPGMAYSTVPLWNQGEEFKSGTSMAAPHLSGLAALLLSAATEQGRSVSASDLRRALVGSARVLPGQSVLDVGAGQPDVTAAWTILSGPPPSAEFEVEAADRPGGTAVLSVGKVDTVVRFRITRTRGQAPVELSFTSDAPWLEAPGPVTAGRAGLILTLTQRPPGRPGTYTGTVRARVKGSGEWAFAMTSTVVVPETRTATPVRVMARIPPGGQQRVTFAADSGRPFSVRIESGGRTERLIAALHQPGGQPVPDGNGLPAGPDTLAAGIDVDGADARAGFYEAVAVAPADGPVNATISVRHAPVRLTLAPARSDSVVVNLASMSDSAPVSGRLRFGLLGAEQVVTIDTAGSDEIAIPLRVPGWAREVVADLAMDPAQWPRFTDFGFAALDEAGRILEKEPANYARTRLAVELPEGRVEPADALVRLVLAPGFADAQPARRWTARVRIRWIGSPEILAAREGDAFQLSPGGSTRFHAASGGARTSPPGSRPLLLLAVESEGSAWTWQLPLP
ncbi:MAG: S8 family serine peptidase [Gemmatimonadales bacterium]